MKKDNSSSQLKVIYNVLKEKGWPLGFLVLFVCIYLVISDVMSETGVGTELGWMVTVTQVVS